LPKISIFLYLSGVKTNPVTDIETIYHFYNCFQERDVEGMISCYHPKIVFIDPAFGTLEGERVFNMWRMLISRLDDHSKIEITSVYALNRKASCNWTADYLFGKSKRQIHNEIESHFRFEGNRIIEQRDVFDIWEWSKQAIGIMGYAFGWTYTMNKMIIKQSNQYLDYYINKQAEAVEPD
jgi:limonene-1,2-epoxide hydrolase